MGAGATSSILGHPNPHAQAGRQGTMNNQLNVPLDGQGNRHRRKKVTNVSQIPVPRSWMREGAAVFHAQCASCHGVDGTGTLRAPRLAAPSPIWNTFHTEVALKAYIQAHMPADHPGTLTGRPLNTVATYVWHIAKTKA